ncbi:hypothetical protein GCM10022389_07670 [Flavobacterium cheonanense]|uniref:Uncharacterized protein n=1 Tax=Flavobacterium cheonanense TaxID=706183 RepID=A0ABP7VE61_9FLAO
MHELNNTAIQDKPIITIFFMILNFKSFAFNINTNIYKCNSNTIDYEILTFIYNIWHKKKRLKK